ncbi:polysaccharide pyruvyl transferase family protein [Paenibacillus septentrionalis]|uniref:Polysaccharide pyruvyl transferase family protein n=1 Tax=Paenibacillus septentrionalis TaxID=429342 RepID=A0ABW1VA79_9BACL
MKIAILTLNGYENYGNRLQNYALERILSQFGEVVTLFQHRGNYAINQKNFLSLYNQFSYKSKAELLDTIKKEIVIKDGADAKITRFLNFKVFSEKHLNEVYYLINEDMVLENIYSDFDYFVVGSDQVWNPVWQKGNYNCLLPFDTKAKKISISASFGVDNLGDKKDWYKQYLSLFDYITVREYKGIEILAGLGIESELCLDPTLLLPTEHWKSKLLDVVEDKKYIILYFLGGVQADSLVELISQINKNNEYKIINFNDIKDSVYYSMDPFQFISYINSAELILTDSFHGLVFANIFNTPYIIFERSSSLPNMNSRIETMDILFNVGTRKYENIKHDIEQVFNADFNNFNVNIEPIRLNSYQKIKLMLGEK